MDILNIDQELKNLLPPLSDEEFISLEEDIVNCGRILQPVLVWNGVIIDGHNRYEIAQVHELDFETKEIAFESKEEAKLWIIKHQMGRRNLNDFQRAEMAIKLKSSVEVKAKANQRAAGGAVPMKSTEPVNTREELAKLASSSEDTIRKVEVIMDKASVEDIQKLRSGECSINSVFKKVQYPFAPQSDHSGESNSGLQNMIMKIQKLTKQLFEKKNDLLNDDHEAIQGIIQQLNEIVSLAGIAC